ncbi:BTB/POZ domain-containing protein [Drosera capensis]
MGYSAGTLYDIDCVQRILDNFMMLDKDVNDYASAAIGDEAHLLGGSHSLTPMTLVANLVDGYLAEVAPDVNLKLPKFQSLAAVIPDYARPLNDGIYRAIDVYLKAHPWLTESEREQICQLLNCQKLSLEASTHAAQNERLPLRVIVQVLFFEQLRLRTCIAGWFYVSDNLDHSFIPTANLPLARNEHSGQLGPIRDQIVVVDDMKERVFELEKECLNMKQELDKIVKNKRSWNLFLKKLGQRLTSRQTDQKPSLPKSNEKASKIFMLKATAVAAMAAAATISKTPPQIKVNGKLNQSN